MASIMLELEASGGCTEALLQCEGFSEHEIEQFGPVARAMANRRAVRQDAIDEELPDDRVLAIVDDRCLGFANLPHLIGQLREAHVPTAQIDRLWPQIRTRLAKAVSTIPAPSRAEMSGVFA